MYGLTAGGLSKGLVNSAANAKMKQEQLRRDQLAKAAAVKAEQERLKNRAAFDAKNKADQQAVNQRREADLAAAARNKEEALARQKAEQLQYENERAQRQQYLVEQEEARRKNDPSRPPMVYGSRDEQALKVEEMKNRALAEAKAKADAARQAVAQNQARPQPAPPKPYR